MRRQKMKIHRLLASRDGRCKRLGAPTQIVGKKKMRERRRKLGWTSNAQPISDA